MEPTSYVYHIVVSGVIRYVGKGIGNRSKVHTGIARRLYERRACGEKVRGTLFYNKLAKALRDGDIIEDLIVAANLTCECAFYLETLHIKSLRNNYPGQLWNTLSGGDGFSSADAKRRWRNPEQRRIQSDKMKALNKEPEYRQKKSEKMKSRYQDAEQRQIQSERMRAVSQNSEWRRKNSEQIKALAQDPERRRGHSERMKTFHQNPEYRRKHIECLTIRNQTPKARRASSERMSDLMRTRHQDPKYQRIHSERMKAYWASRRTNKKVVSAPFQG